jgi:hypothetical protein
LKIKVEYYLKQLSWQRKGFDWSVKAYIETLEHTLELSDGENILFHHLPRVLIIKN